MQESLFSCPAQHQPMRCADTRACAGLEKPDGEEFLRDSRVECEIPVLGAKDSWASSSCTEIIPHLIIVQTRGAWAD